MSATTAAGVLLYALALFSLAGFVLTTDRDTRAVFAVAVLVAATLMEVLILAA